MLDRLQFKRSFKGLDGPYIDEWFCSLPELDVEIIVGGGSEGPNEDSLSLASNAIEILDVLKVRSRNLLDEYIKGEGDWSLQYLEFGAEAKRQECDFILSYKFELQSDPWRHTNVFFNVGFILHTQNHARMRDGHAVKIVVGFH